VIFGIKPAVVGHRGFGSGASRGYRENSLESFLAAAASGATWVELDVRRSCDDELVVWHDPHTPAGLPVVTRTASQLAAEGIIALAAVLSALPARVGVDMDVKTVLADARDPVGRRTHALVAGALADHKGTRPLLVSSFDPSLPLYLRDRAALAADVGLGLITSETLPPDHGVAAAVNLGLSAACLYVGTLGLDGDDDGMAAGRAAIRVAHQAGLELMTWTATPGQAVRAIAAGIDAVCVDDVAGTLAALASPGGARLTT
jgi:glycerophosphoryl diester phosphodiesterase